MLKSGDSQQDRQLFFKKAGLDPVFNRRFVRDLLKWNREINNRDLPWKGEKDPYKIWLSEIILQQTRVEQGLQYYLKFIRTYKDIRQLAGAPDSQVYKLWEGLGYYTRCTNLVETARYITRERGGRFPDSFEDIGKLRGVGPYTAAAIASFAYGLPHAVVDGNVYRLLARVFGISRPIDSSEGKNFFEKLANILLDKTGPGVYNQAIMDFGARVCKPANPDCRQCVFRKYCKAFTQSRISAFPVRRKKPKIRERWFNYLIPEYRGQVCINQRTGNDIWKNLYEFVLIEAGKELTLKNILTKAEEKGVLKKRDYTFLHESPLMNQVLSHQKIKARFIRLKLKKKPAIPGVILVSKKDLARYAFPGVINSYLQSGGL